MQLCLYRMKFSRLWRSVCAAMIALSAAVTVDAAMDPAFELDSTVLNAVSAAKKGTVPTRSKKIVRLRHDKKKPVRHQGGATYTVRSGDNLFKILMRDYGLSNDQAEAQIVKICHENNIPDIKRLKVGQKISINVSRRPGGQIARDTTDKNARDSAAAVPVSRLYLEPESASAISYVDELGRIREIWKTMVTDRPTDGKPLVLQSNSYSLTLDPVRYPVFAAMDGARIVLDKNASIPPLIKSLIVSKDPSIRIVSESPLDRKRFLGAILANAGFYSIEKDFHVEFGADPKLRIHSDFKIEKTVDSLLKQDVIMLNSGANPTPAPLSGFLKQEGFAVYEPFAISRPLVKPVSTQSLYLVESRKQPEMVAGILTALQVPFQNNQLLDVYSKDKSGISLSVNAERFFVRNGQKFVISEFDGDPVTYTLYRILETKGYHVVMLNTGDDFRKVSEKIMTALRIPARYSQHDMWPDRGKHYSLSINGFRVQSGAGRGGQLFLTDRLLDPLVKELLQENGYEINVR